MTVNVNNRTDVARSILAAAAAGTITAAVVREESIPPLADPAGPDAYPRVTLRVTAGDWTGEVEGWKVGWWECGPNRRDNGSYIGPGWSFLLDTADGTCSGRPTVTSDDAAGVIALDPGENLGGLVPVPTDGLTIDERDTVADALTGAIEAAYDAWEPAVASEEEVYAAMTRRPPVLSVDAGSETVHLYAAGDDGRPAYAYSGDDSGTIYDDPDEALEAAAVYVRECLEAETERIVAALTGDPDNRDALRRRATCDR